MSSWGPLDLGWLIWAGIVALVEIQPKSKIEERILEARAARPDGAIACDGDGTVWSGDVGEDLFHALLESGAFRPPAHAQLRVEAREHGLDDGGTAREVARRIYDAYLAHAFPEERVYELMAWAFAGWSRAEVALFAREVVALTGLDERMHREVTETLAWAKSRGIETFLVSASPRAVVEEAAQRVGVAPSHVLAATPALDGETVLARVERPIPYGPGKVAAIRRAIGGRTLYAAFGDNAFDVAMLGEAKVAVAVRPKARLRDRAAEVPGLVEIAPIL